MDMAAQCASRIRAGLIALSLGATFIAALVQVSFAGDLRRLAFHDTVEISHCERFAATEEFSVGKPIGDRALGAVGFNFTKLFLAGAETDARVFTLQAWTLRYSADDVSLIKRLGGEERVVIPLCSVHHLIAMGSGGGSHTDQQSNFAFARSPVDGRVMAIHWFVNHDRQWVIGAAEIPHPLDLPAGSRVFSQAILKAEGKSHVIND
jgi:hypothetical protein